MVEGTHFYFKKQALFKKEIYKNEKLFCKVKSPSFQLGRVYNFEFTDGDLINAKVVRNIFELTNFNLRLSLIADFHKLWRNFLPPNLSEENSCIGEIDNIKVKLISEQKSNTFRLEDLMVLNYEDKKIVTCHTIGSPNTLVKEGLCFLYLLYEEIKIIEET